jgi:hydrogenase-4 component E
MQTALMWVATATSRLVWILPETSSPQGAPALVLLLIVLCDFAVLGTTRLSTCIRALAFQGALLGVLPLLLASSLSAHILVLALGTVAVKAIALPWFLRWAIREAAVRREVEPLVGFIASLLLGALAVGLAFAVAARLPLPEMRAELLVPVSLATVIIGFIVLITRRKAITQVVGYLMLENGIYLFGLTQAESVPFLLELGVLLDVFVGVFIMGIVVFHINREFDSLDSARLTELTD